MYTQQEVREVDHHPDGCWEKIGIGGVVIIVRQKMIQYWWIKYQGSKGATETFGKDMGQGNTK